MFAQPLQFGAPVKSHLFISHFIQYIAVKQAALQY